MPHCGYSGQQVHEMYDLISTCLREARKNGHQIILGGDWNAEVPADVDSLFCGAIGKYGNPSGNERGDWFRSWILEEHLTITNTQFKKRWGRIWTHTTHDRKRVIDYFGVGSDLKGRITDSGATNQLD